MGFFVNCCKCGTLLRPCRSRFECSCRAPLGFRRANCRLRNRRRSTTATSANGGFLGTCAGTRSENLLVLRPARIPDRRVRSGAALPFPSALSRLQDVPLPLVAISTVHQSDDGATPLPCLLRQGGSANDWLRYDHGSLRLLWCRYRWRVGRRGSPSPVPVEVAGPRWPLAPAPSAPSSPLLPPSLAPPIP